MLHVSTPVQSQRAPNTSDHRMAGIPRKLHYIWFGGKPKSAGMEAVIDGWRKLMPECEVIEWNESNFDVGMHPWMKRMHEERRYAFASDYARFHILKEYGGVYLDTDVVMKKSIAPFLDERCFFSFEFDSFLSTCIIAAEPGHPVIASLLAGYDSVEGPVINNIIVTEYVLQHYPEFRLNNHDQRMNDGVRILPKEYFVLPSFDRNKNFSVHNANNHWKDKPARPSVGPLVRGVIGDVLFFKLLNVYMNQKSDFQAKDRARRQR